MLLEEARNNCVCRRRHQIKFPTALDDIRNERYQLYWVVSILYSTCTIIHNELGRYARSCSACGNEKS